MFTGKLSLSRSLAALLSGGLAGVILLSSCSTIVLPGTRASSSDSTQWDNLEVFDDAWQILERQYYDEAVLASDWSTLREEYRVQADTASSPAVLYAVLGNLLSRLDDAHTRVQDPVLAALEAEGLRSGLGIRGRWIDQQFVVEEVANGSPAERAGIRQGWLLTAWNGFPMGPGGAVNVGYTVGVGDTVRLSFVDPADSEHLFQLAGAVFPHQERRQERVLPTGSLYLRFDHFSDESATWFRDRVRMGSSNPGLIIDLRNNRGGKLGALKDALSILFKKRTTIGTERLRDGKDRPLRIRGSGKKAGEGFGLVMNP